MPPPTQPAFPGLPLIDFRSITVPGTSSSSSLRGATKPQNQALQQQPKAQPSTPMAFRGSGSFPQGLDDPALLQQMLLSNPHELSLLKERNPPLAEALLSGDLERFTKVLLEQQQDRVRREQERIKLLTADPFDLEAQAKIEEDIRQHNVEENMTIAMEEAPESFGQVVMLYINCRVNGHPVKAFVDSGAQMTIMSQACAERCNIMRLVDRRWAGIAKGVGTQKIIGRVHLAQVQIEGDFLPCSFSILEDQPMDMLLGLDMLKRHQCSIDLKKNVLLIGTTGTETRFLSEAELPECARLAYGAEGREDARPDELADRELAEALQRSIQETDTADGQATSLQPKPFALPRTLEQMSSSSSLSQSLSSGQPQNPMQDSSQSVAATMEQASAPGHCQDQPSFQELPQLSAPAEETGFTPHQVSSPPPALSSSDVLPVPSPTPEDLPSTLPPVDVAANGIPVPQNSGGEVLPGNTEGDAETDAMENSIMLPHPEEISPIQPMDEEVKRCGTADEIEVCESAPAQPESIEMEFLPDSQVAAPFERDHPDGEHYTNTESIPSLAATLKELHELLVSNNVTQSQNRSPAKSFRPDADRVSLEPCTQGAEDAQPTLSPTIMTEPSDTKANNAAVSDEGPFKCVVLNLSGHDDHLGGDIPETLEEQVPLQDPGERRVDKCQQDDDNVSISQPEPEGPSAPGGDLEIRELSEVQQSLEVTDESQDDDVPDTLVLQREHNLLPAIVGSLEDSSSPAAAPRATAPQPTSPATLLCVPQPLREQFPAEHIQRIQAAGFSAQEAAEALEKAHGIVEVALLALLARSITVPT
ncbi:protein DDI1 homolog 2 isoform X2 [Thalassophryne amazonica]|nr:protein DDI1 homolog 2 isoform X2 [Thalassophryne amazonica]